MVQLVGKPMQVAQCRSFESRIAFFFAMSPKTKRKSNGGDQGKDKVPKSDARTPMPTDPGYIQQCKDWFLATENWTSFSCWF